MFFPLGGMIAGDPVGAYQQSRKNQQQVDLGDISARADQALGLGLQDYFQTALPGGAPMPGLNPATQAVGRLRAMGAPPMPQAPQQPVQQAMEGVEPMIPSNLGPMAGGFEHLGPGAMRTAMTGSSVGSSVGPMAGGFGHLDPRAMQAALPGAQSISPPMGGSPGGATPGAAGAAAPLLTPGAGAPPAGAFTPTSGMLDWRGLVQSIIKQGEKDPRVIALAVNKAMTLMNPIAQQEWREMLMGKQMEMLRLAEDRNRRADLMMDPEYQANRAAAIQRGKGQGQGAEVMSDDAIAELVDRRLAGDKGVTTNLGKGIQGPANLNKYNEALARTMKERSITGADLAKIDQQYVGGTQYQRSAGTQAARVESASNEVAQLLPQALETSRAYPRGNWVPINKLIQMWDEGTSDPKYNDFIIANFSLMNAYARAMNPTGQPRVTERLEAKAAGILSQATSQQAYEVQANRLWKEVQASKTAVSETREGVKPGNINAPMPQPSGEQSGGGAPKIIKFDSQGNRIQGKQSSLDEGRVVSDASPDPIRPGQQYASAYKLPAIGKNPYVESGGPGSGRSGQITFPGGPDAHSGDVLPPLRAKPTISGVDPAQRARLGPMLERLLKLGATPEQIRTFTPQQAYDFIKSRNIPIGP